MSTQATTLLKRIYSLVEGDPDRRSTLRDVADLIMSSFRSGDIADIEYLLEHGDPAKMTSICSSSILRFSAAHRAHLDHWPDFLNRTIEAYKAKELDWEHILRGLLTLPPPSPWGGQFDQLIGIHPTLIRK